MHGTLLQHSTLLEFMEAPADQSVAVAWECPGDLVTPVLAALRLYRKGRPSYLLESTENVEQVGRFSFLGGRPLDRFEARADEGRAGLQRLRRWLEDRQVSQPPWLPALPAGAVGYLGFDAVRMIERLPSRHAPAPEPEVLFVAFRDHLVFDHLSRRMYVVTLVPPGERTQARWEKAQKRLERLRSRVLDGRRGLPDLASPTEPGPLEVTPDRPTYEAQVLQARESIFAGDIFQVVLARRFQRAFSGAPLAVYRALRAINPSPFQVYFDAGCHQLVGCSPEDLVRVHGRRVETLPIAGTRRRGRTPREDRALEQELLADPKERAEHMMLVDLARNDLGRVSEAGSVKVASLAQVQRYSHVMHLVSRVTGTLRPECDALDALMACFPAGTVSGAPKVRAMEIIDDLEAGARGPYAGAVCYFDGRGNLDSCITIRTLLFRDGQAIVHAGAGVVADSDPAAEARETEHKAGAVLDALERAREFA
jgi:anthranilate synthase component 1